MPIYLPELIQQTIRAILAVFQFRRRALVISAVCAPGAQPKTRLF